MWDKSNCSVICTLFKITFLGMWDERGERLFLWPLTSFPDCHTYFVHSVQYCLLLVWIVLLGPHQDLWLCNLLSDVWHEQPQFLSLLHHGTSLHNILSTCLRIAYLQSNFRWSLTGHIADVAVLAETFESLIWLSERSAWNFPSSSLLQIPRTCLQAAASYPLWALSVPQLSVLDIGSCLILCFSLFHDCCENLTRYVFLILLRLDASYRFGFSGYFQQDCLGTFPEIFWGYLILCSLQCRKPVGHNDCPEEDASASRHCADSSAPCRYVCHKVVEASRTQAALLSLYWVLPRDSEAECCAVFVL